MYFKWPPDQLGAEEPTWVHSALCRLWVHPGVQSAFRFHNLQFHRMITVCFTLGVYSKLKFRSAQDSIKTLLLFYVYDKCHYILSSANNSCLFNFIFNLSILPGNYITVEFMWDCVFHIHSWGGWSADWYGNRWKALHWARWNHLIKPPNSLCKEQRSFCCALNWCLCYSIGVYFLNWM